MTIDKIDDVVPVVVGQPLGLTVLVGAKVFRSFFLGWLLCDLSEADLEGALNFRADVPFADLSGDISILTHELGQGGAVLGDGKPPRHSILAKPLTVLAHH